MNFAHERLHVRGEVDHPREVALVRHRPLGVAHGYRISCE